MSDKPAIPTILVVDDEESILRMLSMALEELDVRVVTAKSCAEAREIVHQMPSIELAVLDKNLLDGSGFDVGTDVSRRFPTARLIMLTGYSNTESAVDALRSGFHDYLAKPLDIDFFLLRCSSAIEESRLLQDRNRLRVTLHSLEETAHKQQQSRSRLETLGRLVGGVAHDLNNVFTILVTYADIVHSAAESGNVDPEDTKQIVASTMQAVRLVRQLLESGRDDKATCAIGHVISEMTELLKACVSSHIALEIDVRSDAVVRASRANVEQIVLNLVINARDAMESAGSVKLSTELEADSQIRLDVRDTGCGMTEERIQQVLQPFFSTKGDKGTGLGLATVNDAILDAGGTLEIESEVGKGSCFTVRLPVAEVGEHALSNEVQPK